MVQALSCEEVRREISNHLDKNTSAELRAAIDEHLRRCTQCQAVFDGMRNVVALAHDERAFPLPSGFSERLRERIRASGARTAVATAAPVREVPLGIADGTVPLGSHMVYFWQDETEFRKGVKFLEAGLANNEHCVIQGHQEAIDLTLRILREDGWDPDQLIGAKRVTLWIRGKYAGDTMQDLSLIVEAATRAGAPAVRMFGNLGRGKEALPGGEDDILELEAKTTTLISHLPCVLVCMYDVRTISGRLVLKGGMQSHPLQLCEDGLHHNQQYIPEEKFLPTIRRV
jgi:hypothetical protein